MRKITVIFCQLFCISIFVHYLNAIKLYCPPTWVGSGEGSYEYQDGAKCSWGSDDTIGRSFENGRWYAGSISSSSGILSVIIDNQIKEFDTYQILFLPEYCILSWQETSKGVGISNAVPVFEGDINQGVIGRSSHIAGCGWVDQLKGTVEIAPDLALYHYEVLVSEFPELQAEIRDFTFQLPSIDLANLQTEMMGITALEIQGGSANSKLNYDINHRKVFEEVFYIKENIYEWFGVEVVNITFPVFYGSKNVKVVNHRLNYLQDTGAEIKISRETLIENKVIYSGEGPPQSSTQPTSIQICTVLYTSHNLVIPLQANIVYRAKGLATTQVKFILEKFGRRYDPNVETPTYQLTGELSGIFPINTKMFIGNSDPLKVPCGSYMV